MARSRIARCGVVLLFCLATGVAAAAGLPQFEQPGWTALTPEQKAILAPLQQEWAEMDAFRRKKWLGIAQRYPTLSPTEQASQQRNMREWARLAPEERKTARQKYQSLRRFSPEERQVVKQKWDEYSTLTDEEKERLRNKAPRRPQVKTPARPPAAAPVDRRVATPHLPPPPSPLSPRKAPQSTLLPPGTRPAPAAPPPPKPPEAQ